MSAARKARRSKPMKSSRDKMLRRAQRVRTKLRKVAEGRPRLSVARSHKNISAQIIDDEKGITLASASTLEKDVLGSAKTGGDAAAAALVGKTLAERAKEAGVEDVVFDRGGYMFHGRVKALADAAREGGLKF
jgi:large subunit ribosomal protein L18|mmetsp:Transcript_10717/g.27815  ORF Transcript_10717/g.27815 Transcript_10717/m.27815 type:complete len:133 (+) Transcript_10717:3241-3639(+)